MVDVTLNDDEVAALEAHQILREPTPNNLPERDSLRGASLTAEQKHSIDDPIQMEKAADALPIEQVAKRWIVASDPDEAVDKVAEYVDYGFNHLPRPGPRPTSLPRALRQGPRTQAAQTR